MFAVACITYMLRFFDAFTLFYMRCVEVRISEIKIIFKNIFILFRVRCVVGFAATWRLPTPQI